MDQFSYEKNQRQVWMEEINGLLAVYKLDGTSSDAKQKRMDLLQEIFGSYSKSFIENLDSVKIQHGYEQIKSKLEEPK